MAHIRKLPSGNFNALVVLPNGRRKSITDPLKRVVEARARELEMARDHGLTVPTRDRKLTLDGWAKLWFAARRVEAATAKKNDSHWRNHVQPRWGSWPLSAIERLEVQAWVNDMARDGAGPDTVHGAYNLLSKMLADAVLSKKIPTSPCVEIGLPKIVQPSPRWLSREEYGRIQLALADMPGAATWQAFVGLGAFSGLRCPGELAGLDVGHVDFERSLVRVQQVLTRQGLRAYPKTAGSVRSVPFPPEVGELLWRLLGDRGQGPVFTSVTGRRVNEANFRNRVWTPALAAAGVEYARPYILRHTCASWLIQAGVPEVEIVRMLGHSSARLVRTYAHLAPDRHDRVRAAWLENTAHVVHTPVEPIGAD